MGGIPILGEILDVLLNHPILAFLVLLAFLSTDSWFGINFGFNGVVGTLLTWIVNFFFGVQIQILSIHILLLFAFGTLGLVCAKWSMSH